MADRAMSAMTVDSSLDGTERILAEGADGSIVLVSAMAAYAVDQLHGADVITTLSGTDEAVIFQSDVEKIITVTKLAAWVVDTIEAVDVSTIIDADWIIFSDDGELKKITLANLAASFTNFPITELNIDGGTDINEDLVDADEIIVDNGGAGTNRRCDISRVFDYIEDKIQALTGKSIPLDADILTIQDTADATPNALKALTVGQLWDNRYLEDMLAVSDVSAATWVIDENTLVSNSATKVPTQQSVKQYVDTNTWDGEIHDLTSLAVPPVAVGDLIAIADEDTALAPTVSVTVTQLFTAAGDLTDLGGAPAIADRLLVTDEGSGAVAKSMTTQNLFDALDASLASFTGAIVPGTDTVLIGNGGTAESATYQIFMDGVGDLTAAVIATTDTMVFVDATDGAAKIETVDDLFGIGPALTAAATVDVTADHMLFLDGGATGTAKKCSIQSVFDDVTNLAAMSLTILPATDKVLFDDGGTAKSATYQVFMNGLEELTAAGAAAVAADKLVYLDGGVAENITVQNLFDVSDLAATARPIDPAADEIVLQDAGVAESCTYQVFMDGVNDLTALAAAPDVTDNVLLDDNGTAKKCTVANLFLAYMKDMTPGSGISSGTGTICEHSVTTVGGLIKTEILIDLTGLNEGDAAGDIIGDDAEAANCHIGQITAAVNGTIIAGRVTCPEAPLGGDIDVDIWGSATEATGRQDYSVATELTSEVQLLDHGNWAAGETDVLTTMPSAGYLYLATGAGTTPTDIDYTGGIFLIELWGI